MMRIKSFLIALLFIPAIFVSCESNPVFHEVSYEAGSYAIPSIRIKHDEMLKESDLPSLADKGQDNAFDGWYLAGERISAGYRVTRNIRLQAVWHGDGTGGESGQDTVMVSYATSIGDAPLRRVVPKGSAMTHEMLDIPGNSQLAFDGWYIDGKDRAAEGMAIKEDITLVARWSGQNGDFHLLSLYYKENSLEGESYFIQHGGNASDLPILLPEGAFGWQTKEGTAWNLDWPIYSNFSLYAAYDKVNVRFYASDGLLIADLSVNKGSYLPDVDPGSRPGYIFQGWYTKDGKAWDMTCPVTEDMCLNAGWEAAKKFQVSYQSRYGAAIDPITVSEGYILTEKELPELEHESEIFAGWYDQNGKKAVCGEYKVIEDVELTALWTADADELSITNLSLKAHEQSVTLFWTNPTSQDLESIKVEIRKNSSSFGMKTVLLEAKPGDVVVQEFSGLDSGYEYDFRLYPVFKNGSTGERVKILGVPSKYAGKTAWVHGVVPPSADRWIPETDRIREMVYWQEGDLWFDVNKTYWDDKEKYPNTPKKWAADSSLCWAAASANTIHWWMEMNKDYIERYAEYAGPSADFRTGIQDRYPHASEFQRSEIFQHFIDNTWDDAGYDEEGINWFLSGVNEFISSPIHSPERTGGLFRNVFNGTKLCNMASRSGKASMAEALITAFDKKYAINFTASREGLIIGHVMTIWGAEFDEQGYVSFVYTTDNNPKGAYFDTRGQLMRSAVEYRVYDSGANYAVIEDGVKGYFRVLRNFCFTSLGTEYWEAYFRNNP